MGHINDVLVIWEERRTTVTGKGPAGGPNLTTDVPDHVIAELRTLLKRTLLKA